MRQRFTRVLLTSLLVLPVLAGGCKRGSQSSEQKPDNTGHVNVNANTPAGDYHVNVQYPKDHEPDKKQQHD